MSYITRSSIVKTVSSSLGIGTHIDQIVLGDADLTTYNPMTSVEYKQIRRYLHDLACHSLIDCGLYQSQEPTLESFGIIGSSKKLRMQKPDLLNRNGEVNSIGEVTASYNPQRSLKQKNEKYQPYIDEIRKSGLSVEFNVHIIDLSNPEWMLTFPPISDVFMELIENMMGFLRHVHLNPRFAALKEDRETLTSLDTFTFEMTDDCYVSEVHKATGETFKADEIKSMMGQYGESTLSDQEYLDAISLSILNNPRQPRPVPNPDAFEPRVLIDDFKRDFLNSKPTTNKVPRILQLGAPKNSKLVKMTYEESRQALRETKLSGGYLDYIKSSLELTDPDDHHIITLPLSQAALEQEQLQGPGKKSLKRKLGIMSKDREVPTHIGVSPDHVDKLTEFIDQISNDVGSGSINDLNLADEHKAGVAMTMNLQEIEEVLISSSTTSILLFYQHISKEITLNSMRRRKNRQYALFYSGFSGVYGIIAPGSQLRTESNTIFTKIISLVAPLTNKLSAPWNLTGDHWESDWLSVDTDRLAHWQRSFDRVSVSMLSNVERLVTKDMEFQDALKIEVARNYPLLALTYLENKRTTSTTNQTIRYLWMKSLGDKEFKGLMSKFPKRVNSYIQSFMIQRSVDCSITLCNTPLSKLVKLKSISRDDETGMYDETTTGVPGLFPRLFTFGDDHVPISYNLNEIYWCMAYNKDRQNSTQDAMGIITKILKEEIKYEREIDSRTRKNKLRYLFGSTSLEQDIKHIHSKTPESHYYSHKAVSCGIRLQDSHTDNYGAGSSWLTDVKVHSILTKNLSEFATYKASVASICERINKNDMEELKNLGKRTKAIELVANLVKDEKLQTAMDVAMSYSGTPGEQFEILIQIFKKNQIGGVREIIILFIKARILFNIVEEICRLLSKSDKREILTKGRDKRLMMRGDYEEVMSSFPKGTPVRIIKESYDMSTWCQKFIPTIFMPIYEHHFTNFDGMKSLARFIFMKHSNKKMEIPKQMVGQWMKHPKIKHEEDYLQSVKDKFLQTGATNFVNHSNMCQGIPHYNSTVLALSCLSLRDALFSTCLKLLNKSKSIEWRTRAGSDDKGTIIGLDMSKPDAYYQYLLLGQCEHAAERLHSMELSVKSASGSLLYELNSAFMANLETMSPTIKFALASTDTIGTTSCTKFVNESYGRIRQMRENGSSSLLCSYAHSMNSTHFYDIFATMPGMENDLTSIFKTSLNNIPYDYGVYPQYDVDLQDIIGPEYYNYKLYKKVGFTKPFALLYSDIGTKESSGEQFKMFDEDTPLMKKDHFGIKQGLVRQLVRMRERVNANSDEVSEYFQRNPFMMIRGPETLEETLNLIYSKLFTQGASESLRRTSNAIYIGRLAAFRTSRSWFAPSGGEEHNDLITGETVSHTVYMKATYREYLTNSLEHLTDEKKLDIEKLLPIIYPQSKTFDVLSQFVGKFGPYKHVSERHSQAVKSWTVNNYNYEFHTSLKSILETSFKLSSDSPEEDVEEFRRVIGFDLSSLESVIEQCRLRGIRPLDLFYLMMKIHKSSRVTKIQTFSYGPSTTSVHLTSLAVKRYNHFPGMTMILDIGLLEDSEGPMSSISRKLDDIKLLYNLIVMRDNGKLDNLNQHGLESLINGDNLLRRCLTIIRSIKSISGYDTITQKTLKLVACELMLGHELRQKLTAWRTFNYTYIKKQHKTMRPNGTWQWSGDLSVLISDSSESFTVNERKSDRYVVARKVNNLANFYLSLKNICKTLDFDFRSLFTRENLTKGDIYLSDSTRNLHIAEVSGIEAPKLKIKFSDNFTYRRITDMDEFKIVRDHNSRTGELQIYLKDKVGRTSTICHSNGNFYPVRIPYEFTFLNDRASFLGVRLNKLFENKHWFFDFRLPKMSRSDSVQFLRSDVDLDLVLNQDDLTMTRIHQYMEAHEDIDDEMFGLEQESYSINAFSKTEASRLTDTNLFTLFHEAMNQTILPDELTGPIDNWADEMEEHDLQVENQEKEEVGDMMEQLDLEEGVNMVRAFGYKKPRARRAMNVVSSLRQGSVIKSRILNLFFRDGSIDAESNRQLPNMYLYLLDHNSAVTDQISRKLNNSLMDLILTKLSNATGMEKHKIDHLLSTRLNQHRVPIAVHYNLMTGQIGNQTEDLYEEMLNNDYDSDQSYESSVDEN